MSGIWYRKRRLTDSLAFSFSILYPLVARLRFPAIIPTNREPETGQIWSDECLLSIMQKSLYGYDNDKENPVRLTKPDCILPARFLRETQFASSLIVYSYFHLKRITILFAICLVYPWISFLIVFIYQSLVRENEGSLISHRALTRADYAGKL